MNKAAILTLLWLCATLCRGAGHLEGTVRDGSQAVVPETSILCVAEETGFRFHTRSDREGNYSMTVPDGSYNIIVRRNRLLNPPRASVSASKAPTLFASISS